MKNYHKKMKAFITSFFASANVLTLLNIILLKFNFNT